MRQYWKTVFIRANSDTLATLGYGDWRRLWVGPAQFAVALFIIRLISGESQVSDEWRWGIAVIGGLAASYIPLFIYNFIRAPDRIDKEKSKALENRRRLEVNGELNPLSDERYDLFASARNPTAQTVRNVSASLESADDTIKGINGEEKIERIVGMPLRPKMRRDPHVATPTQIDIHPDAVGYFEIGRINFHHEKKHIALSIAETSPSQDTAGRTWYSHGVDRCVHLPQSGLCRLTFVIRGEDIGPKRLVLDIDVGKEAVKWLEASTSP